MSQAGRAITFIKAALSVLTTEGYLVIFDRRTSVTWADKIYLKEMAGPRGERIHVFGA